MSSPSALSVDTSIPYFSKRKIVLLILITVPTIEVNSDPEGIPWFFINNLESGSIILVLMN